MKIEDFEKELQLINKDLSIRPNNPPAQVLKLFPDVANLASVTLRGSELCTLPAHEIFDEPNGSYGVDLRNDGRFVRHRTRPEVLAIVKDKLFLLANDKDYAAAFFGTGDYSESALRSKVEPTPEIVDEVSATPQEIQGGMIEGPQ